MSVLGRVVIWNVIIRYKKPNLGPMTPEISP